MATNGHGNGNGKGNGKGNGHNSNGRGDANGRGRGTFGTGHGQGFWNGNYPRANDFAQGNGHHLQQDQEEVEEEVDSVLSALNVKERKFVEAYVGEACGNGRKAIRVAGIGTQAETSVANAAHLYLKRPHVKAAIAALLELDPLIPGRIERLRILGRIARREEMDHRILKDGTVVEVPARISDAHAAVRTLAQMAGELNDRDKKQDEPELPADLTVDQLFELAGVTRSNPVPVRH